MRPVLRRVAAFREQMALLAVLALVATALVTGVPRTANHLADLGLRERVAGLPYTVRDLMYRSPQESWLPLYGVGPEDPAALLDQQQRTFRPELAGVIGERWYSAQLGPKGLAATGAGLPVNGAAQPAIGLRAQPGITAGATLTSGAWPGDEPAAGDRPAGLVRAAVSGKVAAALRLRVGSRFRLAGNSRWGSVEVVISGIFEPRDPTAPLWDEEPELLTPFVPIGQDNVPYRGVLIMSDRGVDTVVDTGLPIVHSWRYRVDPERLAAQDIPALTAAVVAARHRPLTGTDTLTGLDTALLRFAEKLAAVRGLLAIVQTGVLVTLFGLVLLAARAAVERRREELALLRARGGATTAVGGRLLAESLLVVPLAVALGWWATSFLPGAPAGTGWLAVVFGLLTALAAPAIAMASQRRVSFVRARSDLVSQRPAARRLTAELSVLVAAGLGAYLLRRRGVGPESGVDLFLAAVPVLVATAAALVALRLFPWPLRVLGRVAARARGGVLFLGLTGAGRSSLASVGPLAVMVVAIATGVFSAVVTTTVDDARDRAADAAVGADIRVGGHMFSPETARRLSEVAGVRAVVPVTADPAQPVLTDATRNARRITEALVIVVDAPEFARVMAASGVDLELPSPLTEARRAAGPVPAVVSPAVAAEVDGGAAADVQGQLYEFRVAAVAATFPTVDPGALRFVVLPAQALIQPAAKPVVPTGFLVAGDRADVAALVAAGDRGQRDWFTATTGRASPEGSATTVTTWAEHRHSLERSGGAEVLSFTFASGAAGGTVLALLAVGFAVLAGARSRGRVLSRLRTMGMSGGQGRSLLLFELAPLVAAGVATGAAVGLVLPPLLAPALDLRAVTDGYAAGGVHLEPAVVGALVGLLVLGLITALGVEWTLNRRLRLGEVLRLGEENGS
ncbi:MAG TPA: ABC transporter permease [Pilimelia sp.]|nr:ABC transporter permease [Pilimelia sp.]